MFSEITRFRPACARRPEVAMPIERAKSPVSFAMTSSPQVLLRRSALADRGFQKVQAFAVERGGRRVVHLVGGHFQHLLLEADRVAGRPGLEACLSILPEAMAAPDRRR